MINYLKYLLLITFSSFSFATTIHVATTGSDDTGDGTEANPYATIQKGINNLSSGDTIIVYDGNYNGAININTGDIVIKSQNGNLYTSLNTVIYLGNYDALIEGFEISLDPLFLGGNVGVHIDSGFLNFRDCNFSHFEADPGRFMFDNDYGNLIFNNVSMDSLTHSSDDFLNNRGYTKFVNSILNNSLGGLWAPTSYEGEIIFSNSFLSDDFFVNNCQIDSTFNSTILQGTIKYHATNSILITMFSPTISEVSYCLSPEYIAGDGNITSDPFFCDPGNDNYTLSENSPAVGSSSSGGNIGFFPVGCGVYDAIYFVSNNGSDENGDGSINNPYFSIQTAIDIANDFDTVKVDDGIYMENIYLSKRVALVGESREGTIIDGSNSGRCVELGNGASISSFTLTNGLAGGGAALFDQGGSLIDNLLIKNNKSTHVGYVPAGILVANSSEIKNCIFYQNEGWVTGVESYGDVNISNCLFNENINIEEDGNSGWLFLRVSGTTTLNGLTIVDNQMPYLFETNGGGLSDFYLLNSIVYNNLSGDIDGNITVSHTNFQGGIDGDGNIDTNPFFCDPVNNNYFLSENSQCVAAGIDGMNMGAYGIGCESLMESLTINEIMNNPSAVSDSDGEWFEIYNNGDVSHDLNGWTIKDNGSDSHVISSSLVINPGEFKVLSNNFNQNTNGGLVVDYQYDGINLANGDDELVLIDPNGTVFDSVAYDGGPEFPDLTGASMGVIDAEIDNNVGSNWQASTTAYGEGDLGTPGLPNFSSDIDVALTTIDFDTVLVGESSDKVLTISNTGNTILVIDSIYTSSGLFTLPFTETSIETSLELTITFTPSEYGVVEDMLVIKTNDPDESHLEIPLIAFGYVPSPNIVLETTSIDFGTVMDGLTETIELNVANDGDAALSLSSVYIEGSTNFTIPNFSTSVAENDTGLIDIQFSPDDETSFSGTLCIVSNDPDTDTLMLALSGVGGEQAPIMTLSDDELYFGTVQAGTTVEREVIIYNEGMLDLEIEEITINGSDYYTTTFSDGSVEPGDSVVVPFSFAPTEQVAAVMATATVASNDGTQTIELKAGYNGPVWHVATIGSDETGDGTEENPFATIQYGIDNIPENDSILVHEGIYFENINFNGRKISVIGENKETTIIDGNQNGSVVTFENGEDSTSTLSDFKIMNGFSVGGGGIFFEASSPTLNNLLIINNYAESFGGGIHCNNNAGPIFNNVIFENNNSYRGGGINIEGQSNPLFFNSIITNNSGSYAGGAYIWGSNSTFSNVVIAENQSDAGEGAFSIIESNISFTNCTITGNQAESGGGIFFSESSISVLNSIFWDNVPFNMYENPGDDDGANNISLSYSNFQGGWEGVGINNIDLNPLFCDQSSGDFTLAENSPCIGSGENGTDIGALGVGCENAILSLDKELLPNNFALHQNYPNPFNPTTKIIYDLPEASYVTLSIYDLMGREVRTIINSKQTAGFKNIQWNATDNLGKSVPAGMYIYTIQAGEFRQTRKMVLLK